MMLYLGIVSLITVGCTAFVFPETKQTRLAWATNDFGLDLLKSSKNEKNVIISPFSISTALALVYLGADGTTAQDLRSVLKYDKYHLSEEEVHQASRYLLSQVKQNTEDYQLRTYNEALVQDKFIILHMYGAALKQYYLANIDSVDFETQGEAVKARINSDVERETNGKIKNFLDSPPSTDTKLFLLNAVYFLGNWKKPFNPDFTRERVFYNNGLEAKKVPMMYRTGRLEHTYSSDLKAKIFVLHYKGEHSASMIIVLPDERTGVDEVQQKLSGESFHKALTGMDIGTVDLLLPKFSIEYSANLEESLTELGLGELFSDSANLNRIAGENSALKVTSVVHKAVIDVNEKGSEAAAATGIEISNKSLPPIIRVDHPFLFFIRENQHGTLLFSGRVDEL